MEYEKANEKIVEIYDLKHEYADASYGDHSISLAGYAGTREYPGEKKKRERNESFFPDLCGSVIRGLFLSLSLSLFHPPPADRTRISTHNMRKKEREATS